MRVALVPWSRLDPGNDLARAYLADPPRALPLFAHDYREPRALRPLVDARRERPRLGAILERYNREVGGSPENAVIIGEDGVLNGPLRFPDELVRHKILDLLGDLYLLGKPLVGTIIAHGAGHQLHLQLVHRIQEHLEAEPEPFSLSAAAVEQWVSPLLPPSRPLKAAVI